MTLPPPEEGRIFTQKWERISHYPAFEARQMSEDTYQIRSSTHMVTVNQEGYDIFISRERTDSFVKWLADHHIESVLREEGEDG